MATWTTRRGVLFLPGWVAGAIAFTMPAPAHHSLTVFDSEKRLALSGRVHQFQFINPHCSIRLLVEDADGTMVEWTIEMGSPAFLVRRGFRPGTLRAGDRLSLIVHPLRDGGAGGFYLAGTRANGQPLESGF